MQAKHLHTNAFKIYSASAGSGKTYQLTSAYLKLILAPKSRQKYRELLAITFTNKAVAEMKQRILESLFAFSQEQLPKNKVGLFKDVQLELRVSALELRKKAKKVLKELLHNYAFFEISTIDKFTHKIIRTFARDLKISQGFDVVLDTDALLEEAIGRLLNRAGEDDELTNVLLNFSLEKIENDKNWDITYELLEIGKLLFQENHKSHLNYISSKEIRDFVRLKNTLKTQIKKVEAEMMKLANETLEIISSNGLEFTDFKASYFPKFMEAITSQSQAINFKAAWKQDFENTTLYTTKSINKDKIDALHPKFLILFATIKQHFYHINFLKNCYKNIVPLTVLNEIAKQVSELQKEKEVLPIAEFNSIIAKEIKNQPVPFIYERLGEKYRHYFIDEFQDTSQMQWQNLIPLIGNAVESENEKGENGSLLLVGDAKQAIYRWRGGRAEQFLNLLNVNTNPFVLTPKVENLDTNWRSQKEIINFNNSFFSLAAKRLSNPNYKKLFEDGNKQKYNTQKKGYVEIVLTQKNTELTEDSYCEKTLEVLNRVLSKGYQLQDICILVRDNKKGAILADFLTKAEIPIISPDSLLLANNSEVSFLVCLLQYIENPKNKEAILALLGYLHKNHTGFKHDFFIQNLTAFSTFLNAKYGFRTEVINRLSIYDILEQAIAKFSLAGYSDAHLTQFMDEVFDFSQKEDSSIFSFLNFWKRKKEKLSVKAPESLNAVKIMTVHKAKGLEFPIVIFPYADTTITDIRNKKLWLPVNKKAFEGFDELLINANKELANYNEIAKAVYTDELHKSELDAYNVLYVAMTRAKNALFVISSKESKANTYSELFIDYLKYTGNWNPELLQYCFGIFFEKESENKKTELQESLPYVYTQKSSSSFKIVTKAAMLWDLERQEAIEKGVLIHKALSKVTFQNDIEEAITSLLDNGDIAASDIQVLDKKLKQVVFHPQLHSYYNEEVLVYNEKELLTPEGDLLRPDRLVIENKNITIIDYKTGSINQSHKNQLLAYGSILKRMNYVIKDMILVYINETIKPIFI